MTIDINSIKYIPDLPGAKPLSGSDILHLNQQSVDVQLSLTALAAFLADVVHPIGSLIAFGDKNKDPNTIFPGQTWVRLAGQRSLRVCKADESDLGTLFGSDALTLTTAMLPAHDHPLDSAGATAATVTAGRHGHASTMGSAGNHNHGQNQTQVAGNHVHGASIGAAGGHDHEYVGDDNLGRDGGAIETGRQAGRYDADSDQSRWAKYYKVSYVGDHAHTVSIGAAGDHTHQFNLNADGNHVHSLSIIENGEHVHRITGKTGTAGGASQIDITNASIGVAVWKRTA